MPNLLRTHLTLARVSNLPTTWSNVLCAFLLVGGLEWGAFAGAIIAVSLFYIGGMYLNDWRDADYDSEHQPYRPIPSKQISRTTVLVFASMYFVGALAISITLSPASIIWSLALLACIAFYDLDHKQNAMSPWVMAGCRALIYPWAASLAGQVFAAELWVAALMVYIYTLGLTYIARGPVRVGALKCAISACLFVPAVIWASQIGEGASLFSRFAVVLFLVWTAFSVSGWWKQPPNIGFSVKNLIAGFIFLDLMAISVVAPFSVAIPIVCLLLLIFTLKLQIIISGT